MPKGGARPGSGPAPSLDALKRVRDGKEWVKLPSHGVEPDDVPPWPAHMADHTGSPTPSEPTVDSEGHEPTVHDWRKYRRELAAATASQTEAMALNERERAYWHRLWTEQPQAYVWRADGTEDQVALFVRASVEAGAPGGSTSARTLVKQLASDLLLNTAALHSARYVIDRAMKGEPAMPDAGALPATGTGGGGRVRSIRDGLTIVPPTADDDDDTE